MTGTAILLIVISSFTHAGWNTICKAHTPSAAFFLLLTIISLILLTPFFLLQAGALAGMPPVFWLLLVLSGAFQAMYYIALASAYRLGEISVVYPMARSIPVLLTPIVTGLCGFGRTPTLPAFAGMGLIFCGCVILPRQKISEIFRIDSYRNTAFLMILTAVVFITGYTVTDREELRLMNDSGCFPGTAATAVTYIWLENFMICVFLLPYILLVRTERAYWRELWRTPWAPAAASIMCTGGYFLVLCAMQMVSNVSYVVALRQLSLPLGVAMGILLLKERFIPLKILGVALLVAGLVLVALF